jgi:hypothetical protein
MLMSTGLSSLPELGFQVPPEGRAVIGMYEEAIEDHAPPPVRRAQRSTQPEALWPSAGRSPAPKDQDHRFWFLSRKRTSCFEKYKEKS